jgi:hypothetical protein
MITENNPVPPSANVPFRPGQIPRADDLNKVIDGVNRAGKLLGGGRAFSGGGPNPTVFVPTPSAVTRGFWGKVSIPSSGDYPDERYFIFKQRATGGADQYAQIEREDDPPETNSDGELNEDWPITATNNAEIVDHTHSLPDGTIVWVTAERDISDNPQIHYSFSAGGAGGDKVYPAQILDECDGVGGVYKARAYIGVAGLDDPDCIAALRALALPEGMAVGVVDLLAVHTKEQGLKTHWIGPSTFTEGVIRLNGDDEPVLFFSDGYAKDIGGPTLESGPASGFVVLEPVDLWDRNLIDNDSGSDPEQFGNSAIGIYDVTRVHNYPGSPGNCQADPPKLIIGMRPKQYDAQGQLRSIGIETQLVIPGCCPPNTALNSPSFATEEESTYARALSAAATASNAIG